MGNKIMAVRIHDIGGLDPVVYVAHSKNECRDTTAESVFDLVHQFDDVITQGCIIGQPIYG